MFSDTVKKTVKMVGNVHVAFQQQSLSCDTAIINMKDESIEAIGHVILETMKTHIEASRLKFYYKSSTGLIYDGFVQSGQVIFEGEFIEKTGPDTYIATRSEYTACTTCPPGWSFSGSRIEAEMGGYAYIKRPVFKVAGVPIFIFPAMMVPLKSTRQSGFLVPSGDYGDKGGLAVGESFFWAIDRSRDITLTLKNYELRGLKGHEDYRYVLGEGSTGRLEAAFLGDRVMAKEVNQEDPLNRYFYHYQHHFELPDNFVHRMEYVGVSDLRYARDFPEELKGWGDPAFENRMSLTKNMESHSLSAEADLYTNQLKSYPLSDNDDAVHKMPELRYSKKEQRIGQYGPTLRWDLNYTNFAREQFAYDSLIASPDQKGFVSGSLDGSTGRIIRDPFKASDIIRTGQRIDLKPTLAYPFQIYNRFDIVPSLTYRETQYKFDLPANAEAFGYSPTAARRYLQTDLAFRTEFSSVFGDLKDDKSERYKHSIEPEVTYSQIPYIRNPNHPFFGDPSGLPFIRETEPVSDSDVNGKNKLQFDYADRVFDRKLLGLSLTNKLVNKTVSDGNSTYTRVALFRLSQNFDFTQSGAGSLQPWSPLDSLLILKFKNFETYSTASYNGYAHITNVSSTSRAMLNKENYLLFSYNRSVLVSPTNEVLPASETENYGFGLGFTSRYVDAGGIVNYSPIDRTSSIQSFQYFLVIRPPGNCWHLKMVHSKDIGGETVVRFQFNLDFTGGQAQSTNSYNATQI